MVQSPSHEQAASALDPMSPRFAENPYLVYDEVREHWPVVRMPDEMWVFSGQDEVVAALGDSDRFSSARNLDGDYALTEEAVEVLEEWEFLSHGMFNADPPDHSACGPC